MRRGALPQYPHHAVQLLRLERYMRRYARAHGHNLGQFWAIECTRQTGMIMAVAADCRRCGATATASVRVWPAAGMHASPGLRIPCEDQ